MLAHSFWRAAVIMALWLASLTVAQHSRGAGEEKVQNPVSRVVPGKPMDICATHIKSCGVTDPIQVIYSPTSTSTIFNPILIETTTELPAQTSTITSISIETVNKITKGHCRDTTVIPHSSVTTITIDVNVTTTREIVPISYTTTVEVSTIEADATEQCFVKALTSRSVAEASPANEKNPDPAVPKPGLTKEEEYRRREMERRQKKEAEERKAREEEMAREEAKAKPSRAPVNPFENPLQKMMGQ